MNEYMPAAGDITLAYQIDKNIGTSTWTTIFNNTTNNSVGHTAINIESSGETLPDYGEIMFRIESVGNAKIIGFRYKFEIIDKNLF